MFSAEEVRYLRKLPAVANVTRSRIMYSEAFKRSCLRRYFAGESPVRMFREAGLDPSLVGYKRIERCFARWKAQAKKEGMEQYLAGADGSDAADFSATLFAANESMPSREKKRGGGGVIGASRASRDSWDETRDLIIAQQARRIDQLEHELARVVQHSDGLPEELASIPDFVLRQEFNDAAEDSPAPEDAAEAPDTPDADAAPNTDPTPQAE
nr:hypothetical protein [Bifidobacterium eulemuris]